MSYSPPTGQGSFMRSARGHRMVAHPLSAIAVAMLAQASFAHAATPYQAPRTSWGAPDLQGTWTNASLTSLERDDMFKGKAVLTRRGGRRSSEQPVRAVRRDRTPSRPTPASSRKQGSDPGGYNAFWLDPGTKLAVVNGEARTSFIVDPANGKVPYTPAGLKAFRRPAPGSISTGLRIVRSASVACSASARPAARRCCPTSTTTTTRSCRRRTR